MKQHTCTACGCVFRYSYDLDDWRTPAMSQTLRPADSVRIHPCPDCGVYQPEMVMWLKVGHPLLTFATFLPLLLVVLLVSGAVGAALVGQIGVGAFVLLALLHIAVAWNDPNGNLEENRALAARELAAGKLERIEAGNPDAAVRPRNLTLWHAPAFVALLAAPVLFFLGTQWFTQAAPAVSNPGMSPAVVGPGDSVRYTLTRSTARGVTGKIWRGTPIVRIINHKQLGIAEAVSASGSNQQWGESFKAALGSHNETIHPTIEFTLPREQTLAGQTVQLHINLPMTFPQDDSFFPGDGKRRFRNATATVVETVEVRVADASTVRSWRENIALVVAGFATSLLGGCWLTALAWLLICRSSKWQLVSVTTGSPSSAATSGYDLLDRPELPDVDLSKWGRDRALPPRRGRSG